MIKNIILPDLGEGIEAVDISEVLVKKGDKIVDDDPIVVLESDKATMEIPAEVSGVVSRVFIKTGDQVSPGEKLMAVDISGISTVPEIPEIETEIEEQEKEQPKPSLKEPAQKTAPASEGSKASPGVRRLARELEIDLSLVRGTGPKGRITKDDLHGFIRGRMAAAGTPVPSEPEVDFSQWGEVEVQKLTRIKKITGERLQKSWQTIPHVTQFDQADITALDVYRRELKKKGQKKDIKVTFLAFLLRAAVRVLQDFPVFNSSLDTAGENLVIKKYYHLGVAVDTPEGLTVPVIRDVDQKSVLTLSKELMDLSERARNKSLKLTELKGASFTISSLGGIGGMYFTPIINPPEVAILGISKAFEGKHSNGSDTLILPFSLSYDHRVIDGASAAAFTKKLGEVLGDVSYFRK